MIHKLLTENEFSIVVSLPKNEMTYAWAARDAEAKILKVHINAMHHATNQKFGTFQEEKPFLEELCKFAKDNQMILGIVPGDHKNYATKEELRILSEMGFDFVSSYVQNTPFYALEVTNLEKVFAIGHEYDMNEYKNLEALGIDVLEASIMKPEQYGEKFTIKDYLHLSEITKVSQPVLVPTQKFVTVEDLKYLKQAGVKALMVGAVVFPSLDPEAFRDTLQGYLKESNNI
ncbi:hypothetical protein [Proteiniclasticum ruminis]|uniref:Uncharacterized protein n=1 Tax=Proteiniclasticum ruminis TaxID=398199 RepID=A0A1G8JVI1_9CLOT|nr:hypothetical protein [Proteiniclasticum ruminis]SDI35236.1 hypothetical protein SAMN05421804_102123 [Proteiniclasticum ruminis]